MTAHLLESTLLLGIAIAAAHLPRLAARTRYAIVFLALLKFAVPWKYEAPRGTISIAVPRAIAAAPRAFAPASHWPAILQAIWIAVAVALFLLILWRARRAVAEALDGAVPAPEREQAMVPVPLLKSPGAIAPAAIGIVRPRIVLPAHLELGDDELAAILAHECAHVARRDNLLALVDAAFGAALWFHPLVWIARRILARAREEACDEIVVARGAPDVYLGALAKVCRAAAAPRVAGVSCIVSNTIRERMNAIMTLPLRRSLPHRLVVAVAVVVLAAASLLHASEKGGHYSLLLGVDRAAGGQFLFDLGVLDKTSGTTVAHRQVTATPGASATVTVDAFRIVVRGETDGGAIATLDVYDGSRIVEHNVVRYTPKSGSDAEKMTLQLNDADLKDVVRNFAKIANLEPKFDDGVSGQVTVELHGVTWQQALQQILAANGCDYAVEGTTLHVRRVQ